MTWQDYSIYMYIVIPMWVAGMIFLIASGKKKRIIADILLIGGTAVIIAFTVQLWIHLDRPPLRTLAETRLWYGVFLAVIGLILYYRWRMLWFLGYSLLMATVFLLINYFKPDTFDQTLKPALQSPWFIPHVIVYIFAYSLLSVAAILSVYGIFRIQINKPLSNLLTKTDNIVNIGFAFLTFGLLFGALWAKEAWGQFWTWDPKETWSLITWMTYLLYFHFRFKHKDIAKLPLWILLLAMVFILITWFGVNYLGVGGDSLHTYTS